MRAWTKILPFFVVAWLARRECQRFDRSTLTAAFVSPYPGVTIAMHSPKGKPT